MTPTLVAHQYPVAKLFSADYVFTIPGYQRPYSWKTEQARELVEDLIGFMRDGPDKLEDIPPYFLGSIVLVKEESKPGATVVDGQQRLTTLTVLLSALRAHIAEADAKLGISKRIYEQGDVITGTANHYRLTLREQDRIFFQNYVQHEHGIEKLTDLNAEIPDSQARLRENAKFFMAFVSKLDPSERLRLAQFIATRCYMVTVCTPDFDSAYRIFNVLNSRGLDLSATDILKAEITGKIADADRGRYTNTWEDLENDLGRDGFNDLFGHIRMVYRKAKSKGTLLKEFREHVSYKSPKEFIDCVLTPMADAFRQITDSAYASTQNSNAVNSHLSWINRIEFKDWLPPALAFFIQHSNDHEAMSKFFHDMEVLVFSMLIRKTGINERIERCSKLTVAIESGANLWSSGSPLQLSPVEKFATYEALSGPIYDTHSARALSIILLRLDSLLSSGGATYEYDTVTVEHVLPQTPMADSKWLEWYPDPLKRQHAVHRLGNLALLTRKKNSSAKNYDFEKKKTAYFSKNGISPFVLTTQVLKSSAWTESVIANRQDELISLLEVHLGLQDKKSPSDALLEDLGL